MIVFNNWTLTVTGLIARQYDNLSRRIDVEGDLPAGYTWQLLVQSGGNADTILLEATETGAGALLTADNLSKAGEYYIQLRGVLEADGVTRRHTNVVSAYIPESLTGLGTWPEVPTEFAQVEARILNLYQHPPIPGSNGYWLVWDTDKDEYVESQLSLPEVPVGPQGPQGEKGEKGDPGPQGPKGDTGSDATVTAENIESALGYTPASADHVTQLKEDLGDNSLYYSLPITRVVQNKKVNNYNQRLDDDNYDLYVVEDLDKYVGKRIKIETNGDTSGAWYTISDTSWTIVDKRELLNGHQVIIITVPNGAKYGQFSYKRGDKPFKLYVSQTINEQIYQLKRVVTPEMYGATGDGVTDDTDAFKKMLSDTDNQYYPILLSAEKYLISDGLTDTLGHVFMPNKSTIVCNFTGYALTVDISSNRSISRSAEYNLNFECLHISDGVHVIQSIGNKYNIVVKNAPNIGFYLDRSEGTNIYENSISVQIDSIGEAGEIGLYINGNDNFVYSAIIINYKIAIKNKGNTQYTYIHAWLDRFSADYWSDSTVILDVTNTNGATITYLYADTYRYGIRTENYAFVMVHTYNVLINTNEIPISKITEEKHVAFSGNGSCVINFFESYHDASVILIVEGSAIKPRIRVDNVNGIDFIKTCSASQMVFPCSIGNEYWLFNSIPEEIKNAYTEGTVGITPISFGGTNAVLCRYWAVNKIFVNFNYSISSDNWNSIQLN